MDRKIEDPLPSHHHPSSMNVLLPLSWMIMLTYFRKFQILLMKSAFLIWSWPYIIVDHYLFQIEFKTYLCSSWDGTILMNILWNLIGLVQILYTHWISSALMCWMKYNKGGQKMSTKFWWKMLWHMEKWCQNMNYFLKSVSHILNL